MMSTVILRFVCLICLWTNVVGFFFGALGGGNCCCCQPNPCCGMGFSAPLPALGSSGCGAQAAPAFGGFSSCGNSAISRPSSASSYTLPTLPTLQFPTFPAPSMPQPLPLGTNAPAYAVAPTENDSGASPSYTPISSHPPAPPPIPPSSSYADLGHVDTVAKGKIANEITGVDPPTDKIVQTSTSSPGNDFYEEKVPNIEDYGDLTSTSNRSGNDDKKNDLLTSDYSDQSFSKTKVSGVPSDLMADQDSTGDPKCSSETLKTIMQENIVSSPTISKQLIFSAGRIAFGQTIDVICSRNKFSYTVVSSKIFCETGRGKISCFAFLQP